MKITCALSQTQIEKLYANVYGHMSANLKGEKFDAKSYMQDLFEKIANKKDVETAAKFLQQVPTFIGRISYNPGFEDIDINDKELKQLVKDFKNFDTGIDEVLKYFRPKLNPDAQKELVQVNENKAFDVEEKDVETKNVVDVRLRPFSAMSTTFQEFVSINPTTKTIIFNENIDEQRRTIYNTLRKINDVFSGSETVVDDITYKGVKLRLKGVKILDVDRSDLDKTTLRSLDKGTFAEFEGFQKESITPVNERILMVVTDQYGNNLYFDEEGDFTTKEKGTLVYQFLRDVRKTMDGYAVTNMYGYDNSIKSPTEIAKALNIDIEEAKKIQQEEFEELYKYKESILKGQAEPVSITGISPGVPEIVLDKSINLKNLNKFPFGGEAAFKSIITIKTPRDGFKDGEAVITLAGKEFAVDRPNATDEIINKVAAALTNSKLSNKEKYTFVSQFFADSASAATRRHNLVYLPVTDTLIFKYYPKTFKEGYGPKMIELDLSSASAKDTIYDVLKNASGTEGKYFSAKMHYDDASLKRNGYQDYNIETGELSDEYVAYYPLLQSLPNTSIKIVQNAGPDFFNPYITFALPNKVNNQINQAKQKTTSEISRVQTAEEFNKLSIPQKFEIILDELKNGAYLVGRVTNDFPATEKEHSYQVTLNDGRQVKIPFSGWFNKDLDLAKVMANEVALQRDEYEGKDAVGVFSEIDPGIRFTYINENPLAPSIKLKTTPEVVEEETKAAVAPENVAQPTDKKGGISGRFFLRGAQLPSDVTQEQIDDAKTWWENSPLKAYLDFDTAVNIINSDAYARFTAYGEILNGKIGRIDIGTKGNLADVYHEAWHGFSQLFLSKEEKLKLYKELRKELGRPEMSFFEAEEYLAEDFRSYALDQKAKKGSPTRNTLFRRIWNFIKNLFAKKTTRDELFQKLYLASSNPKLLNNYSPSIDNIMFDILNRGAEAINDPNVQILSRQDSNLVKESMDSIISQLVDIVNNEQTVQGNPKSATLKLLLDSRNRKTLYETVKETLTDRLEFYKTKLENTPETDENEFEREELKDKVRILQTALDNYGDAKSGIVKYHIENSVYSLVRQKYIEGELDDEGNLIDPANVEDSERYGDKKVGEKSLIELAGRETIYILKSINKLDKNGKKIKNKLGFTQLVDFRNMWNNTVRTIGSIQDPQEMYNALKAESDNVKEFKQLLTKLADPAVSNNFYEFKTTTSFWQDFSKPRVPYIQLTIFDDEIAQVTEASIEVPTILRKFEEKYKSDTTNPYIKRTTNTNTPYIDVQKVVDDFADRNGNFDVNKSYEFTRAIGMYLDDLSVIKKALKENQAAIDKYGLQYIYKAFKDINELSKNTKASNEQKALVRDFKKNPVAILTKGIAEGLLSPKQVRLKNKIDEIASLQGRYGLDASNYGVLNAERNLVFEHVDSSTASRIVYALNNVENMSDFWAADNFNYMSYLNPAINSFTKASRLLKTIFDYNDNYSRRENKSLDLFMNSGTQIENTDEGLNTTSMDSYGKLLQEMHTMLKGGVQEFMRHASKKSSYGVRISGGIDGAPGKVNSDPRLWIDLDMFADNSADNYAFKAHFLPYIESEVDRINRFKENKAEFIKYAGYNRKVGGTKENPIYAGEVFTAFDNVLTKDTKAEILEKVNNSLTSLTDYLKQDTVLRDKIKAEVEEYFNGQVEDNLKTVNDVKYISQDLKDRLKMYNFTDSKIEEVLVQAYTYNSWIQNFETAGLFYGDVTQYNHAKEEMHKRNTGLTSGGRIFRTDAAAQRFINGWVASTSYAKKEGLNTINYNGQFNTAVVQDVVRPSIYVNEIKKGLEKDYTERFSKTISDPKKLKAAVDERVKKEIAKYDEMEEGDGQGWITIDAYRSLKILENNWSDAQEALFQKIIAGQKINFNDITEFFPVYKVQNFGHLANTGLPVNAMHKFALAPLIPSVIKDSDLESLHKQMINKDIQYVTFQTGSKVGSVMSQKDEEGNYVADKIYDDNQQVSLKSDIQFTPNTIYLEYLKNVTSVPTEYKTKTVFATQLRKLILSNLYRNGELINSKNKDAVQKYENLVNEYSALLKYELLEEIGYKEVDGKYIGNLKDFLGVVQKELGRRGMSEHQIDFVGVNPDNSVKTDLSLHLRADDIEKILVALIEKRLVRQKVKGEALVQVASSMSNGLWDSGIRFKAASEEEKMKYLGTNNLPFYTKDKDGKTLPMKVAVALQGDFNNLLMLNHIDGNKITTLDRLNEMIKSEKWLDTDNNRKAITMAAVRIPVQGLNSMEFMEVYHFLDPAAGNMIIPPTEIVAKSGGDFDVDKLTTFMPSISGNGQFIDSQVSFDSLKDLVENAKTSGQADRATRLIKQQKSALENKLITSIADILALPDNYAGLVRPNDTYLLKEIADKLQDQVIEYDRYKNAHGEPYREVNGKKAISPTRIFEVGYNLHKHDVNMTGKTVLGIVAVENSLNPILNSLGAAMPKTYKSSYWDEDLNKYVDSDADYKMRLLLPHNKMSDGRISLSNTDSVDGLDNIADLLSQMMNGLVDVEKDAWVFFIQANIEIVPTLLYLFKAGVPKETAIQFVSQPLVREYAKQQRLLKSAYANYTGNSVTQQTLVKYQAAQNTLKPKNIEILNSKLFDKDGQPKYDQVAVTTITKVDNKVKFPTEFYTADQLMSKILANEVNIANVIDVSEAKGNRKLKSVFKPIAISNKNYYSEVVKYTEKADLDADGNFKLSDLKKMLSDKDTMSDDAVAVFLHFLEMEKQIKGLQTLKRQMNPDTRTSKTLQETTRRNLALEDAKEMSKIDAGLVERVVKESILGSFFDNKILNDLIKPLFTIRNADEVTDFILDVTQKRPAEITKTFGAGADGVRKFISEYKNAVTNYLFQNYMVSDLVQDGNIVDVPTEYLKYFSPDVFAKEKDTSFADEVLKVVKDYPELKNKYNILNQLAKPQQKRNEKILTLNDNKLLNEPQLAELYYENLKDLADVNVKKVSNQEENQRISDLFRTLPLISIFQTGTGYHKYGFNEVLPYEDFLAIMRKITGNLDLNKTLLTNVFNSLINKNNKYFKNFVSEDVADINADYTSENFAPESEVADVTIIRENPKAESLPTAEDISSGQSVSKLTFGAPTPSTNLSSYTNHSGGAEGSDTEWDVIGKDFGMVNNKHYYTGVKGPKNAPLGNVDITDEPIAVEGASKVAQAAKEMWGYKYTTMKDQRLIRNWAQVANSDAIFAIGTLGKKDDIWKGDEKSKEPRRLLKFAVQGGTGYAVEMAIQTGKPVYVFDQVREQWYKNINGEWSKSEVPTLTKNFAGIGTREINEAGKQAIRDVYTNTFKSTTQPSTQPSTTSTSESVADIPQNKVSGINSYGSTVTANNEAIKALGPNPHSIDMIEAGFRTRTTRSESEMAKYAIKVGDTIKHFGKSADGSTKTVYAKVTAIHPKGSEGWKGTWNKEGWRAEDVNVIDRFKDGAAAIEFEVIQPSTEPTVQPTEVKEGIKELFNSNAELASIGTPEQYSQYLDTIFPNSKVKDIVYRGGEKEDGRLFQYFTKNSSEAYIYSKANITKGGNITERNPIAAINKQAEKYTDNKYGKGTYEILLLPNDWQSLIYEALDISLMDIDYNLTEKGKKLFNELQEKNNKKEQLLKSLNKKDIDLLNSINIVKNLYDTIKIESENDLTKPYDDANYQNNIGKYNKARKYIDDVLGVASIRQDIGKITANVINITNPYKDEIVQEDLTNDKDAYKSGHDGAFLMDGDHFLVKSNTEQIHTLGNKQDIEGFKDFVQSKTPNNPDTFTEDMAEFNNLVSMSNGVKPSSFDVQDRHWILNVEGLYDLVDRSTGEIYLKDVNMETGLQVYRPNVTPVDEARRLKAIEYLNSYYKELDLIFAEKGYDIKDVISRLESLTTQEELNDVINNILKKIC
jgi:hypothetical protein